mgnify:CR=1 FL=1
MKLKNYCLIIQIEKQKIERNEHGIYQHDVLLKAIIKTYETQKLLFNNLDRKTKKKKEMNIFLVLTYAFINLFLEKC